MRCIDTKKSEPLRRRSQSHEKSYNAKSMASYVADQKE